MYPSYLSLSVSPKKESISLANWRRRPHLSALENRIGVWCRQTAHQPCSVAEGEREFLFDSATLTCSTSVSSRTGPKARCELTRARMDRLRSKASATLSIRSSLTLYDCEGECSVPPHELSGSDQYHSSHFSRAPRAEFEKNESRVTGQANALTADLNNNSNQHTYNHNSTH
eukprot:sb/3472156/